MVDYPSLQARESMKLVVQVGDDLRCRLAGATEAVRGLRATGGDSAGKAGS